MLTAQIQLVWPDGDRDLLSEELSGALQRASQILKKPIEEILTRALGEALEDEGGDVLTCVRQGLVPRRVRRRRGKA